MKWFKKDDSDSPHLLSLSPLRHYDLGNEILTMNDDDKDVLDAVTESDNTDVCTSNNNKIKIRKSRIGNSNKMYKTFI